MIILERARRWFTGACAALLLSGALAGGWQAAQPVRASGSLPMAGMTWVPPDPDPPVVFRVDLRADSPDADPSDGLCRSAAGGCSLRAALMQVNRLPASSITPTVIVPSGVYTLTRPASANPLDDSAGSLKVTHAVILIGAGLERTLIDANGAVTHERALLLPSGGITVTLEGLALVNGLPHDGLPGGAIRSLSNLKLLAVRLAHSQAPAGGGGLYNRGSLTLEQAQIEFNDGGLDGGGLLNEGSLQGLETSILYNSAGREGGGIQSSGPLRLERSTIAGNWAMRGGGLATTPGADLLLVNSSVVLNEVNLDGGGLYDRGLARLYNVTVAQNTAGLDSGIGGGFVTELTGSLELYSSLVAGNLERPPGRRFRVGECAGPATAHGHNLLQSIDPQQCYLSGRFVQKTPWLGVFGAHGGPTPTLALQADSPAIDATPPVECIDETGSRLATDQRGYFRPLGPACDLGAFESGAMLYLPGLYGSH